MSVNVQRWRNEGLIYVRCSWGQKGYIRMARNRVHQRQVHVNPKKKLWHATCVLLTDRLGYFPFFWHVSTERAWTAYASTLPLQLRSGASWSAVRSALKSFIRPTSRRYSTMTIYSANMKNSPLDVLLFQSQTYDGVRHRIVNMLLLHPDVQAVRNSSVTVQAVKRSFVITVDRFGIRTQHATLPGPGTTL